MTRSRILTATFALFCAGAFVLLGVAWNIATSTTPTASSYRLSHPVDQSATAYSDTELQSFAEAALEVKRIKETYLPKLQAADTQAEEEKVKETATKEMVHAIEERGLSIDKYHEILVAALTDSDIAHRVSKYLEGVRV